MTSLAIREEFDAFVTDPRFSCLAGKGVVRSGGHVVEVYGELGSHRSASVMARDLAAFVARGDERGGLRAFVAVFPRRAPASELEFEQRLWQQLALLHERDDAGAGWDPSVASDPASPEFAFSFGGEALFVIGLHANSSRLARRFSWPALVFNPHAQFDTLRADGRFDRLRGAVREREIALQGTLNPNLADFGERSEARQYSGRAVEAEWKCPFHPRPG